MNDLERAGAAVREHPVRPPAPLADIEARAARMRRAERGRHAGIAAVALVAVFALVVVIAARGREDRSLDTVAPPPGAAPIAVPFRFADTTEDPAVRTRTADAVAHRLEALGYRVVDTEMTADGFAVRVAQGGPQLAADARTVASTGLLAFSPVLDASAPGPSGTEGVGPTCAPNHLAQYVPQAGTIARCFEVQPVTGEEGAGAVARIDSARAEDPGDDSSWPIQVVLAPSFAPTYNDLTAACFARAATCPTGELAVVLDDTVFASAIVEAPRVDRDRVRITGSLATSGSPAFAAVFATGPLPTPVVFTG